MGLRQGLGGGGWLLMVVGVGRRGELVKRENKRELTTTGGNKTGLGDGCSSHTREPGQQGAQGKRRTKLQGGGWLGSRGGLPRRRQLERTRTQPRSRTADSDEGSSCRHQRRRSGMEGGHHRFATGRTESRSRGGHQEGSGGGSSSSNWGSAAQCTTLAVFLNGTLAILHVLN